MQHRAWPLSSQARAWDVWPGQAPTHASCRAGPAHGQVRPIRPEPPSSFSFLEKYYPVRYVLVFKSPQIQISTKWHDSKFFRLINKFLTI
jgi:hypothetical protein